ncbi:MAG TPA: hypothetical protein VGN86_11080 [Pyrinomonadaceae bacterium]|jgi:hypothetical protein|nr:hypothetical protein [Pyrinomonadaceae bacterium]
MNISEYRAQFASFHSKLELVRFQKHIGIRPDLNIRDVYDRYSDLFSAAALAELEQQLKDTPAYRETEKKAIARLLTSARICACKHRTREIGEELEHCIAASTVTWRGASLSLDAVPHYLSKEKEKSVRRDLTLRWIDKTRECRDLFIQRKEFLDECARSWDLNSYRELIPQVSSSPLNRTEVLRSFLSQTESAYKAALVALLRREVDDLAENELHIADLPLFQRMSWLDQSFASTDLKRTLEDTFRGLGLRPDSRRAPLVDAEPHFERISRAEVFPVAPPEDVRVALLLETGAGPFLSNLKYQAIGKVHSWCSRDLATRYPEFVYSADSATPQAHGYLFRYLALDPRWIMEFVPGVNPAKAEQICQDITFQLSLKARSLCAIRLSREEEEKSNNQDEVDSNCEQMFEHATSFRGRRFSFALEDENSAMSILRALAFSFVLREYLRVRFGHRWWAASKAGDELVDLWNTSSTYSVEELSSSLGSGELNFDLLGNALNAMVGA